MVHRLRELKEHLIRFKPDVISLQYVPYAFDPRGLPFGLASRLRGVGNSGVRWHVMFHEICVGLGIGPSVKHRLIGALQQRNSGTTSAYAKACCGPLPRGPLCGYSEGSWSWCASAAAVQ